MADEKIPTVDKDKLEFQVRAMSLFGALPLD